MDNAFKVTQNGQTYDYRLGEILSIEEIRAFFTQNFTVKSLEQGARYVTGVLNANNQDLMLKVSTTPGTSITLQNEFKWNQEYNISSTNNNYKVPKNIHSGDFQGHFYLITEKVEGELLGSVTGFTLHQDFNLLIGQVVDFAEYIMSLTIMSVGKPDSVTGNTPQELFLNKTTSWFEAIEENIRNQNNIDSLLEIVKGGFTQLVEKPRHGDFTPWHILKTTDGLAVIDGEHGMSHGVENYDLAYLIQRIHSVSSNPNVALAVYQDVAGRGVDKAKLKTVLAARAIGGYLDAFLADKTDFINENAFRDWVLSL